MVVSKWELMGKILASRYRRKVLSALSTRLLTPRKLEQKLNIKISHISFTLSELTELRLVKCATPNLRAGKLYGITKKGKDILCLLKKSHMS